MAMTLEQMEQEITRLKKQAEEGAWAKDYIEIWKVQSMYSHLYYIGRMSEIPGLFAQKTPGVTLEIEDSGVYEGFEGVTRFWTTVFSDKKFRGPGHLAIHMTLNPLVEINKARNKARGIWHSHGFASMGMGGSPKMFLCLGKYDMEYVKEDGVWKILKFAYRIAFMCPYDKGWVDEPIGGSIAGSPENRPDKPTTQFMPYSRHRINVFEPPPPKPYDD
jgi:hypothetical protein